RARRAPSPRLPYPYGLLLMSCVGRRLGPAASSSVVVFVAALCELETSLARGVDRVQERGTHPRLLEVTDRRDRGAAGRRHHLAKLHGVLARVAQHLGRAEHRLDDQ